MSTRTIVTVVLALVFGGSAALGVNQFRQQKTGSPTIDTDPVVVAVVDIARGTMLTDDMVRVTHWPRSAVPPGAIRQVEDLLERTVLVPLVKGEPVFEQKLAAKDSGRGLAALIPNGMRAFTIQTPHVASGVAGFILPGNRVDVLLTMSSSPMDGTGGGSTTTLLQNIEILAVDQRLDAPAENKVDPKQLRSVTLLVTPDQAAKLDLGQNKGILHLSLRNLEDEVEADTRPATLAELRFHQEAPIEEPRPAVNNPGDSPTSQPVVMPVVTPKRTAMIVRTLRATTSGTVRIERHR